MAKALAKPCRRPGCSNLTYDRFCKADRALEYRKEDALRGNSATRGYGGAHRKMREIVLTEEPYCRQGCGRRSTIADHIIPRRQGGSDGRENLQGLCTSCHNGKRAAEGRHSRAAARGG